MAISLVNSAPGALTSGTTSTLTPALPSGVQSGDLIVVWCGANVDTAATFSATGYTAGPTVTKSGTAGYIYKVAGASEGNPTVTQGHTPANGWMCFAAAYRGCDTGTPFDATTVTSTGANGVNTFQPTGITTVTDQAWVAGYCYLDNNNTVTISTANGFTTDASGSSYAVSTVGCAGLTHQLITPAGAVSMNTFGNGSANFPSAWMGIAVALRPLVTVIGPPQKEYLLWSPPARSNHYYQQPRWIMNQSSAVNNMATPLDTAWQAGGSYWHRYNQAADQVWSVSNQRGLWWPQQKILVSDPNIQNPLYTDQTTTGYLPQPYWRWSRPWDRHPFIQPQRLYWSDESSARNDLDLTQAGFLPQSYWRWSRPWDRHPFIQPQRLYTSDESSARNDFDETQGGYLPQPYWTWYRPWDRYPFIQKDMRDANRVGSAVNDLDLTTDALDDLARHRSWRRDWDQYRGLQRPYISTVGLLDTALLEDVLLGRADNERHAWWRRDAYWSAPGKRGSDPSLLTPPNVTPTLLFLDLVDGSLHLQFGSTEMTYRLT